MEAKSANCFLFQTCNAENMEALEIKPQNISFL